MAELRVRRHGLCRAGGRERAQEPIPKAVQVRWEQVVGSVGA